MENGSIKSWDEMIDAFRAKFAVASDRVGIADLANTKPKKGESVFGVPQPKEKPEHPL